MFTITDSGVRDEDEESANKSTEDTNNNKDDAQDEDTEETTQTETSVRNSSQGQPRPESRSPSPVPDPSSTRLSSSVETKDSAFDKRKPVLPVMCSPRRDEHIGSQLSKESSPSSSLSRSEHDRERDREPSSGSSASRIVAPVPSRLDGLKDPTSPPNVTVIHPSVNHPMFSYLYHSGGLYPGSSHPLSLHMSSLMFNQHNGMPPQMSGMSAADCMPHLASHGAGLSIPPGMMFNPGQLMAHPGLWPHGYPAFSAAAAAHGLDNSTNNAHSMNGSHLGPLFASRAAATGHRFTPYTLPVTKTTMVTTSAPVSATGLASPDSNSRSPRPTSTSSLSRNGSCQNSPTPTSSSRNETTSSSATSLVSTVTSELKNIERMVNGLERQQEKIAAESFAKLTTDK